MASKGRRKRKWTPEANPQELLQDQGWGGGGRRAADRDRGDLPVTVWKVLVQELSIHFSICPVLHKGVLGKCWLIRASYPCRGGKITFLLPFWVLD